MPGDLADQTYADLKLFCGTEEPKGSAGQTHMDVRLAKKTARKPEAGR
jgi:hypothetical protein